MNIAEIVILLASYLNNASQYCNEIKIVT